MRVLLHRKTPLIVKAISNDDFVRHSLMPSGTLSLGDYEAWLCSPSGFHLSSRSQRLSLFALFPASLAGESYFIDIEGIS